MKTAEEWIKEDFASRVLEDRTCSLSVSDIRKIQADALRHAANVCGEIERDHYHDNRTIQSYGAQDCRASLGLESGRLLNHE